MISALGREHAEVNKNNFTGKVGKYASQKWWTLFFLQIELKQKFETMIDEKRETYLNGT